MSKLNFSIFLNTYNDSISTNSPSLNNFKWNREINGLSSNNPSSSAFNLAPGESKTLFNGSRSLGQDGTTRYSLALKPLTSNTYILSLAGGTAPNFRTPRTTGADATTQVTVTLNGPLATFTSTGGTAFALISGGAVVGDYVRIGNLFNTANQGEWKIVALSATSFTVENELAAAEGPITLASGFAAQVQVYSASGVQIGDKLNIAAGFSPVTQGTYYITSVAAQFIEFFSADVLPQESSILTQVSIYQAAKKLIYIESDQHCSVTLNGSLAGNIEPLVNGNSVQPGMFLNTATVFSLSITNTSTDTATLFVASVE